MSSIDSLAQPSNPNLPVIGRPVNQDSLGLFASVMQEFASGDLSIEVHPHPRINYVNGREFMSVLPQETAAAIQEDHNFGATLVNGLVAKLCETKKMDTVAFDPLPLKIETLIMDDYGLSDQAKLRLRFRVRDIASRFYKEAHVVEGEKYTLQSLLGLRREEDRKKAHRHSTRHYLAIAMAEGSPEKLKELKDAGSAIKRLMSNVVTVDHVGIIYPDS